MGNSITDETVSRIAAQSATNTRSDTTVRELLDVDKQIGGYLDKLLYSSAEVMIDVPIVKERTNVITGKKEKAHSVIQRVGYKHLPSEDKVFACNLIGLHCSKQTFIPDFNQSYAIDAEAFDGYCIIFEEGATEGDIEKKVELIQKHIKKEHNIDMEEEQIKYNIHWLTWRPMLNQRGFDMVKSSIMQHVAPINSTTIIPEDTKTLGGSKSSGINDQSVDDANAIIQDLILNHRLYGFDNNPTTIIMLLRLMAKLFYMSLSRSLNGITIRGIITNVEERNVSVSTANSGRGGEDGGSAFSKVVNR